MINSLILFLTGILGFVLNRKSIILMLISIEIMLLSITFLILVSIFSYDDILGQTLVIYIIGAGVGIGVMFGALIIGTGLILIMIRTRIIIKPLTYLMPMPGVKCPTCASRGIEQWVLPGKHCPNCSTACRNISDIAITTIYLGVLGYISWDTFKTIIEIIISTSL